MKEIAIQLTRKERDLIFQQHTAAPNLVKLLQLAEIQGKNLLESLSADDLEDLVDHVAGDANHADDDALEAELDRLYEKLLGILKAYQ